MLMKSEKITITGESVVDEKAIAGFQVAIDSNDPENINFSSWQTDKKACKENRDTVRADQAQFENYAYAKQDEMLAAK